MGSYEFLAGCYDELTYDVGYSAWADYMRPTSESAGFPVKPYWTWPAAQAPSPGNWPSGAMR